jgi:hypothetical protein
MGQLGPREQLGDLRMPSSMRPGSPADRVVGRPPTPRWRARGVRPIAATGQPKPNRPGQDAPLHQPAWIVQGDHGVGPRIDHQLGVVRGTIEHPPRAGRVDRGRDLVGEARGLVVTEGVAFDMSRVQPHGERAGQGGLPATGAADHHDPLKDRSGSCGAGCHVGKVRRRWRCGQEPAGGQSAGEPSAKPVDGF